jgi:surface polysaccharide O-acyltransferase-like enzyme
VVEAAVEAGALAPARSASIAWLRVLAITGVVLIHVSGVVTTRDDLDGTLVYAIAAVMNGATRFCVPLFVVVSGALLLRESTMARGAAAFYRKRLTRLLPALVVWHLVYLAFRELVRGQDLSLVDVVVLVLSGRAYTALYFFWLILALYLVAPLLWNAIRGLTPDQRLLLAVVVVALTCAWQSTLGLFAWREVEGGDGAQTIWTLWLPYVGYFLLGGALRELAVNRRLGWTGLVVSVVGAASMAWQVYSDAPRIVTALTPVSYFSWSVALTTAGLWCMAAWFWRPGTVASRGVLGRTGELLGSLTLGVFGIHLLVLYYAQGWLTPGLVDGSVGAKGLVLLAVFVLAVSWTLAWAMSHVPYLRRLV